MKIRNFILLLISCVLLSSCFVKSLHPFYTQKTLHFDDRFIGEWEDQKKGVWKVESFSEVMIRENGGFSKLEGLDKLLYEKYKKGYYVSYKTKNKESIFLVMPFKLKKQLLLDFTPFMFEPDLSSLVRNHLVSAHSLAKFDILDNNQISIKWLDEDRLKTLFKEKKIKIKHQKTGIDESEILLTAKPEELQKFIRKYMASKDENKWESDTKFILTKSNAKP